MKHFLRKIFEDVSNGENIDLIATVVLALIIAFLNVLGAASQEIVSSIMLATLGLMAVGLLITRYRIEEAFKEMGITDTIQFFDKKLPTLTDDLKKAEEIWMLGIILRGTTADNFYTFKEKVAQGTKIRTLIVNPNRINMENIVERFSRASNTENFKLDFQQTINQYYHIRRAANKNENVQLKLLDFVPSFSLYIFPKAENGGIAYVEIYGYKSPCGSIPKFRLTEHNNPEWFNYFVTQFITMWKDADDGLINSSSTDSITCK